jgi:hypothetical protein
MGVSGHVWGIGFDCFYDLPIGFFLAVLNVWSFYFFNYLFIHTQFTMEVLGSFTLISAYVYRVFNMAAAIFVCYEYYVNSIS